MPFKSKSQARYMFSQHPHMAKEFASHTPNMKGLPEKIGGALQNAYNKRKRKKTAHKEKNNA